MELYHIGREKARWILHHGTRGICAGAEILLAVHQKSAAVHCRFLESLTVSNTLFRLLNNAARWLLGARNTLQCFF
jgi:hypothetical protein